MQEKWNQFVYHLCEAKKKGVDESTYHSLIEQQLQLLGWMSYKNEIRHKPNLSIGHSGHIQPDILVEKDNKNKFVIEVKKPAHKQAAGDKDQLVSYMRQLKLEVGVYIGEHIEIFYDQTDADKPVSVLTIPLELDNKRGVHFVELFSKDRFSNEAIVQFCEERLKEMRHQESLNKIKDNLISDAQKQITEGMKMYMIEKYGNTFSESDIVGMLASLSFTAIDKEGKKTPPVPQNKKKGTIACVLSRHANAKGIFDTNTCSMTVLKGSTINTKCLDTLKPSHKERRDKMVAKYAEYVDNKLVVKEDIVFDSPSGAAFFCIGGSSNGWKDWKDEKNNELDTYRKKGS